MEEQHLQRATCRDDVHLTDYLERVAALHLVIALRDRIYFGGYLVWLHPHELYEHAFRQKPVSSKRNLKRQKLSRLFGKLHAIHALHMILKLVA